MSETTAFQLFPAIDILGGRCVRLLRGDYGAGTEYYDNPVEAAVRWREQGAEWLHVVDLDAAKSGSPENTDVIAAIVREAAARGVKVQVGGGIRTLETMQHWLDAGVARCVVGTAALDVEWVAEAVARFGSGSLVVGLDGRNGKLAVKGWLEQTETSIPELARQLFEAGARHALVTDVERDGTLQGANLALAREVQEAGLQAIASGGIRGLDDVLAARDAGLAGAVVGRSLYDGRLSLVEAIAVLKGDPTC
jgi:phosphoribosylformimino-5-aminoimidazole carboxamide ribotide isomerase